MPRIKSGDMASAAFILVIVFPIVLVFVVNATICFVLVFRDWHGNAMRSLMLRLIDGSAERKATNDRAS